MYIKSPTILYLHLALILIGSFCLPLSESYAENVFDKADPIWRPTHVPRASDVVMRSLRPRIDGGERDSIIASKKFHVTRHEWTYLNYHMRGGHRESSIGFAKIAEEEGILLGGAGSGASTDVESFTEHPQEDYCVWDIDGSLYIMPHKRGWASQIGQGSVFSEKYFRIHLAHYVMQLNLGAQSLQRDEGWMAISHGYDFSPHAVTAFREYLKSNTDEADLAKWGIESVDSFDVKKYFNRLGIPEDRNPRWFRNWQSENPIKQVYDQFIIDGVVAFYQRLRKELNDHAGHHVPFSCNNTSLQQWTPAHLQFDWAMSELLFRTANPQHLYERFNAGMQLGKVQVISTPKPTGEIEDKLAFRKLNRRVIAQAYSLGGLCKVPWDLFLQTTDGRGRYFGDPGDYADLYGFVRGIAPYLEGFEEAAAYGNEIPDRHGWKNHPLKVEGSKDIYAYLRVRPRDLESPIVLHVVNWGDSGNFAEILISKSAIHWDPENSIIRILQPKEYQASLHQLAEKHQSSLRTTGTLRGPEQAFAYNHLVNSRVIEAKEAADGMIRISDVNAQPWSVIVIEKL